MSTTYVVSGMTCEHCAASVREEVGEVPGVTDVVVDLPTGRVVVTADAGTDVDTADLDAAVRAAVAEAGYRVE